MGMDELVFEVTSEEDGGYSAKAVGAAIFTQGDSWQELRTMVLDAVKCHYDADQIPSTIRLHLLRDEVLAVA